jgi:hypothetical protein
MIVEYEEGPEEKAEKSGVTGALARPPQPIVGLLDTDAILQLDFNTVDPLSLIQQQTAQLAAIRKILEAEHARKIADRVRQRGGPHCPPQELSQELSTDQRV